MFTQGFGIWFFPASPPNIGLLLDTLGFDVEGFKSKTCSKACWQSHYFGCRSMVLILKRLPEEFCTGGRSSMLPSCIIFYICLFPTMGFQRALGIAGVPFTSLLWQSACHCRRDAVVQLQIFNIQAAHSFSIFTARRCLFVPANMITQGDTTTCGNLSGGGGCSMMWTYWAYVARCLQPYNS